MEYINSLGFNRDNLSFSTRISNSVGDFFLTPVRYMLNGKSGTCFLICDQVKTAYSDRLRYDQFIAKPFYGNIEKQRDSLIRTAISIVLFIPCLIIGVICKAPALLCSERLRRRYKTFNEVKELNDKAYHELRIGIFFRKENHVKNFLNYVKQMNDSEAYFTELLKGKEIYIGAVGQEIDKLTRSVSSYFQKISARNLSELYNERMTIAQYFNSLDS